jgi:hypothetical protein
LQWLHTLLTRALPVPGWCFLNIFVLRKDGTSPEGTGAAAALR